MQFLHRRVHFSGTGDDIRIIDHHAHQAAHMAVQHILTSEIIQLILVVAEHA